MSLDAQDHRIAAQLDQQHEIEANLEAGRQLLSGCKEVGQWIKSAPDWMDRDTLIENALEQFDDVNRDNYADAEALLKEWSA